MNNVVLNISDVSRTFLQGGSELQVLDKANLQLKSGEITALVGPSGSGKSTLLQIAGLLERPDSGDISIDQHACGRLGDSERTKLRRDRLGFVYQSHHLLPEFSAIENVIVPQMIANVPRGQARERAKELLTKLGLGERLDHRPGQLSGGEQQRVAIARALANTPKVLLADEPTGNLDPETSESVFAQLLALVREEGLAALIATHNPELAARMDRRVTVQGGAIIELE